MFAESLAAILKTISRQAGPFVYFVYKDPKARIVPAFRIMTAFRSQRELPACPPAVSVNLDGRRTCQRPLSRLLSGTFAAELVFFFTGDSFFLAENPQSRSRLLASRSVSTNFRTSSRPFTNLPQLYFPSFQQKSLKIP